MFQKFLRGFHFSKHTYTLRHTFRCRRRENEHSKWELPQGIELNVNFPSASDTAWQRATPCRGPWAEPCKHSISDTSSEYKKIWTPNIGFPWKRKKNRIKGLRHNYKRKDSIKPSVKLKINHITLVSKFKLNDSQNILQHPHIYA